MELSKKITHANVFTAIIVLATSAAVKGDDDNYCEFGICTLNEYCCGNNVCCSNVKKQEPFLYILVSIPVCVILLFCCCFYNNCALERYLRRYVTERIFSRSQSEQSFLADKV